MVTLNVRWEERKCVQSKGETRNLVIIIIIHVIYDECVSMNYDL